MKRAGVAVAAERYSGGYHTETITANRMAKARSTTQEDATTSEERLLFNVWRAVTRPVAAAVAFSALFAVKVIYTVMYLGGHASTTQ